MRNNGSLSPSNLEALVPSFERSLADRNLSVNTIKSYLRDLRTTDARLRAKHGAGLLSATAEQIMNAVERRQKSGARPSSIARCYTSMRMFFKFCMEKNYRENNPIDLISRPLWKRVPDPSRLLSEAQLQGIFDAQDGTKRVPAFPERVKRNRIMLMTVAMTAINLKALVALRTSDIDLATGRVSVAGKKGKRVEVILPQPLLAEWRDYVLNYREHLLTIDRGIEHVFASARQEKHMTRQAPWQMLQGRALKVGISRKVSTYDLRRTFFKFHPPEK